MKRVFILVVCCVFLAGCAVLPDYKSDTGENNDRIDPANFKYGKYCGKGHPSFTSSEPNTAERIVDLQSIWPPVDDIDLVCYAHDMCFEETTPGNLICDQAITSILEFRELVTEDDGCRSLLLLISSLPIGKPIGTEESKGASRWVSFANTVLAVPMGILTGATTGATFLRSGLPKQEGECFLFNNSRLHTWQIISHFEASFRRFAKGFKEYGKGTPLKYSVDIQIPLKDWNEELQVFNLQKYLNYYGYKVGNATGQMNQKTRDMVLYYNNTTDAASMGALVEKTLAELREKYVTRSFFTKVKDGKLTEDVSLERYGYLK